MDSTTFYLILPAIFAFVGGLFGFYKALSIYGQSCLQHLAAGMIFSAVALELMPLQKGIHSKFFVIVGFLAGLFLMLAIKMVTDTMQKRKGDHLSWAFSTSIAVDYCIDGFFLGISMLLGKTHGFLIAIALTVEMIFLAIITTKEFSKFLSMGKTLLGLFFLVCIIPLFTYLGKIFVKMADAPTQDFMLSFGVAALLYLVIEELLKKAHRISDKIWTTALFFIGFFIIYLIV